MEKHYIDKRVRQMQEEGVSFKCNVNVGSDLSAKDLTNNYDAIVLACGSEELRDLKNPRKRFKWCSLCYGFFDVTKQNL